MIIHENTGEEKKSTNFLPQSVIGKNLRLFWEFGENWVVR
jgi:hypothetical protein